MILLWPGIMIYKIAIQQYYIVMNKMNDNGMVFVWYGV